MRNLLFITLLAVTISLVYHQIIFAACGEGPPDTFTCNTNPPNPDLTGVQQGGNNNNLIINVLPGAGIDTTATGDEAINTGNGNNQVTVNMAEVIALDDDGIDLGDGNDTVEVNDSTVRCDDNCIVTRNGNDVVDVRRSIVASVDNNGIDCGNGNDVVHVVDSEIRGGEQPANNFGIRFDDGDDMLTINNSAVFGFSTGGPDRAIVFGLGDDTLRLETGARIEGLISCGTDFDTIIFAMDVPEGSVAFISAQIALLNPAGDSITINDLFYEWEDCELLLAELVGVRNLRPIPTLSQWGLIAMAGVLGIVGFMVMRRRKVTA